MTAVVKIEKHKLYNGLSARYARGMKQQQTITKIVGVVIIIIGLYLLLGLIVNVPFVGMLLTYWPLTLVLLGLIMAMSGAGQEGLGAVITLVGLLSVANRTGLLDTAVGRTLGTVMIMLLGILVLVGLTTPKHQNK